MPVIHPSGGSGRDRNPSGGDRSGVGQGIRFLAKSHDIKENHTGPGLVGIQYNAFSLAIGHCSCLHSERAPPHLPTLLRGANALLAPPPVGATEQGIASPLSPGGLHNNILCSCSGTFP